MSVLIVSTGLDANPKSLLLAREAERVLRTDGAPATLLDLRELTLPLCGSPESFNHVNTARSRVVTVAIDAMNFVAPVRVGDAVTCYARLLAIGRTSMKIHLEAWVQHYADRHEWCVTEGTFTYVAIDAAGKPQPVQR